VFLEIIVEVKESDTRLYYHVAKFLVDLEDTIHAMK